MDKLDNLINKVDRIEAKLDNYLPRLDKVEERVNHQGGYIKFMLGLLLSIVGAGFSYIWNSIIK